MPINKTTLETLPDLSEDYPLTSEQIQEYRERGHVLLPNLLSQAEIDAYRPHFVEAVERLRDYNPVKEKLVPGRQDNWIYIDNLWSLDAIAGRFICARRFAKIVAELLSVEAVRLCHDHVIFKYPEAEITSWHQDAHFFPMDDSRIVTLWLPLVDVTPEMGMIIFADGTHHSGCSLGTTSRDEEEMQAFSESLFARGYTLNTSRYYNVGDAEFIDGWNLHCSMDYDSDRVRETLIIVYYPDGARISSPQELSAAVPFSERVAENFRLQSLLTCFPGLQPGDLAVTPMNPLVYSRQRDSRGK